MRCPFDGPNFPTRYVAQAFAKSGVVAVEVALGGAQLRYPCVLGSSPSPQLGSYGSKEFWLASRVFGHPQSKGWPYLGGALATHPIAGIVSSATALSVAI